MGVPRFVVPALLAGSGVLSFAAARERWGPACPWRDFDNARCLEVQAHEYDYTAPFAPWHPVGYDAELAGIALMLLGIALLLLPLVVTERGRVLRVVGVLVGAGVGYVGVAALSSGLRGEAVKLPGEAAAVMTWVFGLPVMLALVAALQIERTPTHRARLRAITAGLLLLATPLAEVFLGPAVVVYSSYDTAPWSEAVSAAWLIAGAATLAWSTASRVSVVQPVPASQPQA